MWFKRRKKTEQDHLLSESLKSLQTLLSESSGRLEPSLDPRHTQENMDSSDNTDNVRKKPPSLGNSTESDDSPAPDSGNRWNDLSLNFDAEPATPRPRRGGQSGRETAGAAKGARTPSGAVGTNAHRPAPEPPPEPEPESVGLEKSVVDDTSPGHVDEEIEIGAVPSLTAAEPAPGPPQQGEEMELDNEPVPVLEQVESSPDAGLEADEEPAIEYFDRGEPPARNPTDEDDDTSMLEIELPEAPAGNSVNEPDDGQTDDEIDDRGQTDDEMDEYGGKDDEMDEYGGKDDEVDEDQLHLELEPAQDDIPTLTDAVYLPDTEIPGAESDEGAFEVPKPDESPYEEDVERCLENLRVRLQLMGLDLLSAEQETELRDSLVEFMDEQGFPTGSKGA